MSLVVENISKVYGETPVLEHVNLTLEYGIYGLLGPNGAGKTTLMRIMTDLLVPSTGRVLYNGKDISVLGSVFRDKLGYLPQEFGVYPSFTAEQFLLYIAKLKGLSKFEAKRRSDELLELVDLADKKKKKLDGFSGGQRQRIGIAQALLNDPQIIIMDEPTAGLDPEERIRFRGILSDLSQNRTVLLSTHIVSDLEAVANEVILLKKGKVLEMKKPAELLSSLNGTVWTVTLPTNEGAILAKQYPLSNISHFDEKSTLRLLSEQQPHPAAQLVTPNMEDMYLSFFYEL
ncbi:MAG: ABC transporter ATP-binding protein [Clostridiales bacterium]|jgi:ABC-2 type transport system ATP-binding protein|nr:ABC transporter ATP-binding protein [Clostridiales bacterium]